MNVLIHSESLIHCIKTEQSFSYSQVVILSYGYMYQRGVARIMFMVGHATTQL